MKLSQIQIFLALPLLGLQMACSTQWREADAGLDGEMVMELLHGTAHASGQNVQLFTELKEDPRSTIFFSDSSESFGPAVSVASLLDFTPLGVDRSPVDLEAVKVFFIDRPGSQGHQVALLVEMFWFDQQAPQTVLLTGEGYVDGKEYIAFLGSGAQETLILRSFNVGRDGMLESVIQLRAGLFEASTGIERPWGKFSTLVGFQ